MRAKIICGSCHSPNGGLSSIFGDCVIVEIDGRPTSAKRGNANDVRLVTSGRKLIAVPIICHWHGEIAHPDDLCGPMFSDATIEAESGSFPLFDRFESWAEYEALSR